MCQPHERTVKVPTKNIAASDRGRKWEWWSERSLKKGKFQMIPQIVGFVFILKCCSFPTACIS